MTLQPMDSSSCLTARSRTLFRSNFFAQNSRFLLGRSNAQRGQLCQKHPCKKTATFFFGKMKSGLPGRSFLTIFLRRSLDRRSSGFVRDDLLDCIDFRTPAEIDLEVASLIVGFFKL